MLKGIQALGGTLQRINNLPANVLSDEACRACADTNKGWSDQWCNWDDLGGDDPGWGDAR